MVAIKKSAWLVLLAAGLSNAQPLVIQKSSVFAPNHLGEVNLLHDDCGFHVVQDGKNHDVQNCFIDEGLRKVDRRKLAAFLKHGYISVNKVGDDDFSLKAQVRGPGGGPIAGAIAYWGVKVVSYGTMAAGATALTITTAGTGTALATGGAATAAGATISAGAGTAAVAGVSAASGAGVVAGAITTAGLGTAAGTATVAAVTSAPGGIAGLVTTIEGAATGLGAIFGACPFLP